MAPALADPGRRGERPGTRLADTIEPALVTTKRRQRRMSAPRRVLQPALARSALRDDLRETDRALTAAALEASSAPVDGGATIAEWFEASTAIVDR